MGFSIIICGGGLGGLAASIALKKRGNDVMVLEAASQMGEVGAGIQIPPNSSRLLKEWGLYDEIEKHVVSPRNIQVRRYATGEIIGRTALHPDVTERYGTPYWLIHRADYHQCLYTHAVKLGVTVRLNSFVNSVDESTPSVTLQNGDVLTADIIVGADGIRSKVRQSILGDDNCEIIDSENCVYRATIPNHIMRQNPETAHLMEEVNASVWIGPQRHIMAYPIRNGSLYNVVMSHPGKASPGKWNEPGDLAEMKRQYADFDPLLNKVLDKVSSCLKWKLADFPCLPRWVSQSGRVVVIGDAAHAMLPYLAQGAASSIEDGASLAECIARATNFTKVPDALRTFESIRKPRCKVLQAGSRTNGIIWHMPDGPEQQKRDTDMQASMRGNAQNGSSTQQTTESQSNPNRWSDTSFQRWLFGHDAVSETNAQLDQLLQSENQSSFITNITNTISRADSTSTRRHPGAVKGRAAGKHPSAFGAPLPFDPSVDGVGIDETTGQKYFIDTLVAPLLSERVNVDKQHLIPLPEDTDAVALAGLINPVSSSWMALGTRVNGGCEGRTVAIVGATSASGRSAAQVARLLGACRVIGVSRTEDTLATVDGLDDRVLLKEPYTLRESLGPIDIMLDYVGGPLAIKLLQSAEIRPGGNLQYVVVGGLVGEENMTLPVRLINTKPIQIMASGVGSVPKETIWRETKRLVTMIPQMGRFLDIVAAPMDQVSTVWDSVPESKRLVIVP